MKYLVTICARGGSKGIPGKNIKEIGGKPLIAYSIITAQKFLKKHSGILTLSTDSEEIKQVASEHGLKTDYLRPPAFATDNVSKSPALNDILIYEKKRTGIDFDYLIDLDLTSPLRSVEDIENALEVIRADTEAVNLVTVSPPHRNPYFNMLERKKDGYFHLSKKLEKPIFSRQEAPLVYDMNSSFYIFSKKYFSGNYSGSITDKTLVYEIPHICFDVDTPLDFDFMEMVIKNKKWIF